MACYWAKQLSCICLIHFSHIMWTSCNITSEAYDRLRPWQHCIQQSSNEKSFLAQWACYPRTSTTFMWDPPNEALEQLLPPCHCSSWSMSSMLMLSLPSARTQGLNNWKFYWDRWGQPFLLDTHKPQLSLTDKVTPYGFVSSWAYVVACTPFLFLTVCQVCRILSNSLSAILNWGICNADS